MAAGAHNGRMARATKSLLLHVPGAAGADEAGRGPLAGPVVAAAVILPDSFDLVGLDDSKKLDHEARIELAARIKAEAVWAIELAEPEEIDRRNILRASLHAMARAIRKVAPPMAYVDGNQFPPDVGCPVEAVIKGDGIYACIAAASILAKTERDLYMVALAEKYPGYGFDRHFGYPTPDHFETLRQLGPCPAHRRSFAPVRELLEDDQLCLFGD